MGLLSSLPPSNQMSGSPSSQFWKKAPLPFLPLPLPVEHRLLIFPLSGQPSWPAQHPLDGVPQETVSRLLALSPPLFEAILVQTFPLKKEVKIFARSLSGDIPPCPSSLSDRALRKQWPPWPLPGREVSMRVGSC